MGWDGREGKGRGKGIFSGNASFFYFSVFSSFSFKYTHKKLLFLFSVVKYLHPDLFSLSTF